MSESPQAIVPGLYALTGVVNVFVLDDGPAGVTIVDTGMPGSARRILDLVHTIGRTPQDVRQILITHADVDHVGSLKALIDATGAAVYASADSASFVRRRRLPPHLKPPASLISPVFTFLLQRSAQVTHTIAEGETLDIAGGMRVLATPGHTPDHLSFYWERERVLFAGDLFRMTRGLELTPPPITWSEQAARRSARKVLALAPAVIVVGHGPAWMAVEHRDQLTVLSASLGDTESEDQKQ